MSYETPDPHKMTVAQLKSALAMHGFAELMPADKNASKDFYINLYKERVIPKLSQSKEQTSRKPAMSMTPSQCERYEERRKDKTKSEGPRRKTMAGNEVARLTIEESVPPSTTTTTIPKPQPQQQLQPKTPLHHSITGAQSQSYVERATPKHPSEVASQRARAAEVKEAATTPLRASSSSSSSSSSEEPTGFLSDDEEEEEEEKEEPLIARRSKSDVNIEPTSSGRKIRHTPSLMAKIFALTVIGLVVLGLIAFLVFIFFPALLDSIFIGSNFFGPSPPPYFCDTTGVPGKGPVPDCVVCPRFGACANGKLLTCGKGFVISNDRRSCIVDEERMKRAHLMKDEVHYQLGLRAGEYQCEYENTPSPEMTEKEVKEKLREREREIGGKGKGKGIGNGGVQLFTDEKTGIFNEMKFEEDFLEMKKEILAHPEWNIKVSTRDVGTGRGPIYLYSTTDVILPFSCQLRVAFWENIWYAVLGLGCVGLLGYGLWRHRGRREAQAEVDELVEEVKDLLEAQKKRSMAAATAQRSAGMQVLPPYIPVTHLRDTLFHDNPQRKARFVGSKVKERQRIEIWKRVEEAISADRRIKTVPQIIDGQQQTTWEWASLVDASHDFTPRKTIYK
jgi:hypothetical protein